MAVNRRFTKQRQLVLEELRASKDHPTAEDIHMRLHEKYPGISLGTVYRNLSVLCEMQEIRRVPGNFSRDRFDIVFPKHYHFQCVKCGNLEDVFIEYQEKLNGKAVKQTKFDIVSHDIVFSGICDECQAKEEAGD